MHPWYVIPETWLARADYFCPGKQPVGYLRPSRHALESICLSLSSVAAGSWVWQLWRPAFQLAWSWWSTPSSLRLKQPWASSCLRRYWSLFSDMDMLCPRISSCLFLTHSAHFPLIKTLIWGNQCQAELQAEEQQHEKGIFWYRVHCLPVCYS